MEKSPSQAVNGIPSSTTTMTEKDKVEVERKADSAKGAASETGEDEVTTTTGTVVPLAASNDAIPNGGAKAWLMVFGSFLVQMCGFGYSASFGVYQDFYQTRFLTNSSPSAISWIGSVNITLLIAGGIVSGQLYDRGYFYHTMLFGSFMLTFGLFMLSLAKENQWYQVFLAQSIVMGIGGGLTYIPSISIIAQYFSTRRSLAMTIAASGSSFGSIIHPILLNNLFTKLSFGNAVRASAGLVGGLLLIACLVLRTRVPVSRKINIFRVAKHAVSEPPIVAMAVGAIFFSLGFYFPLFYIQLDSRVHGNDPTFSFYVLTILNVFSILGRIIPGFFANKLGVGNILAFCSAGCSAVIFAMIGLKTTASVTIIAILYGFFSGAFVALMAPMIAILTPDLSELGARSGLVFFVMSLGSLIGTPLGGALLTSSLIWWRLAVFSGVFTAVGSLLFFVMSILARRIVKKRAEPAVSKEKA